MERLLKIFPVAGVLLACSSAPLGGPIGKSEKEDMMGVQGCGDTQSVLSHTMSAEPHNKKWNLTFP